MNLKEFGLYFAELREKSGYESQRQLSLASGVSNGTIARIEGGTQKATPATLKKLAPYLKGVTYEDLMKAAGYIENSDSESDDLPPLTEKEERDIARDLEKMLSDLESKEALSFHGEPMDEETKEALRLSLESSLRFAKQIAKQKFTPKKYRKEK
ncbi:helix-turn-helix domain-containing protein [Bacillus smithii]|jgi:transcriptional regulator with XRE-family HTH domain|uniref:helix-turn-helix domain-containing protein n=1 Tax=Bacillus smithii TaxID=1479 RepID=UPI003D1C4877